jgi:Zn-dependent protease/predicted transcriptional regulator
MRAQAFAPGMRCAHVSLMLGKTLTIFRLFGIPVRVDASWILIAILVGWSLDAGFFPFHAPGLAPGVYMEMALVGALGLFASIVFHEFAHALVGRRYGVEIRSITLFVFGGVAEMRNEPPSPRAEFRMAIAGPAASTLLAVVFAGLMLAAAPLGPPVAAVLFWLAWANALLAAFNLVPAFPLDGGRVLRAALWHWKGSLRRATRITASIGSGFGILLIGLGVLAFLSGDLIAGVWWALIGLWLRSAASISYRQVVLRRFLEGERVRDFMRTDVTTVPPSLPLAELVEDYVYRNHHKMYPVLEGTDLVGYVRLEDLKRVPREQWDALRVRDVMLPCSEGACIGPEADMVVALGRMQRAENSRLLVVENRSLLGIVTLRDVLDHLALKLELEGEEKVGPNDGDGPPPSSPESRREREPLLR